MKYQYSLTDTARECTLDGDQLAIKIGVAGKVLLGPAGSPGSFDVPVRMAVLKERDNAPVTSKIFHAAVTVPASETEGDFTIVSEPLRVPFIQDHAEDDYAIKVGIDEGPGAENPLRRQASQKAKRPNIEAARLRPTLCQLLNLVRFSRLDNRTKMFHVKHFGKVGAENLTRPHTASGL